MGTVGKKTSALHRLPSFDLVRTNSKSVLVGRQHEDRDQPPSGQSHPSERAVGGDVVGRDPAARCLPQPGRLLCVWVVRESTIEYGHPLDGLFRSAVGDPALDPQTPLQCKVERRFIAFRSSSFTFESVIACKVGRPEGSAKNVRVRSRLASPVRRYLPWASLVVATHCTSLHSLPMRADRLEVGHSEAAYP